jgi:bis(5'-adenosyl)-triphosphatase
VPHVHFHILPRKTQGDRFAEDNDAIYPELERSEGSLSSQLAQVHKPQEPHQPLKVDADEDRPPRTIEEMVREANWLKGFFEKEERGDA